MTTTRLAAEEARQLVIAALVASNSSQQNSASVARALIGAELDGQSGHGLRRVPAYAAQAHNGKIDGHAIAVAEQVKPASVWIDAANGFAYPALDLAIEHLGRMAAVQGIAIAGIARSHHAGVAGLCVETLAEQGLVAMLLANTPAAMAPWGGNRALYGTNPIAFAAPLEGEPPIVVDVSLSKVARGRIMAAAQSGEPIPEGWALDSQGNNTTDARAALDGTMVPLGDAKGTALALMIELLCAGLTGANFAYEASSFLDDQGPPPGTGQTLIAIDPAAFGSRQSVARFAEMAHNISDTQGARIPGRRRQELREKHRLEGIPVDSALLKKIRSIGS